MNPFHNEKRAALSILAYIKKFQKSLLQFTYDLDISKREIVVTTTQRHMDTQRQVERQTATQTMRA